METETKAEPNKTPRFIHFGWYGQTILPGKKKHNGVLTIAYRQKQTQLYVGFVFCSPNDNFSRKVGREKALRIMRNCPIILPTKPNISNRQRITQVVSFLCGIGAAEDNWITPSAALYHTHNTHWEITTPRIPGWAKKWWINLVIRGFGPTPETKPETVQYNVTPRKTIFDMSITEFIREAHAVGIAVELVKDLKAKALTQNNCVASSKPHRDTIITNPPPTQGLV